VLSSESGGRTADDRESGGPAPAEPLHSTIAETPARTTAPRQWEEGEPTRAGGILYLIHFIRQNELLRHFDIGLGGWTLVDLLGRCLLADIRDLAEDAIWTALAHLDGRDPGTPPATFMPRATYKAPASWLSGISASRFARFRSRGVELWTDEGFLSLDSVECAQLCGVHKRFSAAQRRTFRRAAAVRLLATSVSLELRRFLHFVLPYARWRLSRALHGIDLNEALLRKGTLYVTETHVDLVMPMSEIAVPIRMAGLDANPGWAPEFGRVITFHFK
jgi:hypothetical protein